MARPGLTATQGRQCLPPARTKVSSSPPYSAPYICHELAPLTVLPKPPEPANMGPRQTDPMTHRLMRPDGRPTETPHMFHRENAKHPALSSTSESGAHLGCRCSVISRKEARELPHGSACVPGCPVCLTQ